MGLKWVDVDVGPVGDNGNPIRLNTFKKAMVPNTQIN